MSMSIEDAETALGLRLLDFSVASALPADARIAQKPCDISPR